MRPFARLTFALCLALALGAPASAKDAFWAQVTYLKGTATVTPAGTAQAQALQRGKVLHKGDVVRTGEASQVSLLLNDGGVVVVRASQELIVGKSKPEVTPSLKAVASNLSKSLLAREGDNPMLKHLGGLRGSDRNLALAPCRTKIRVGDVTLLWLPKPGAVTYSVTLMGPGDQIAEFTASEARLAVPAASLVRGGVYYWEVKDAASGDSNTILGSATFTALSAEAEEEVATLEANIAKAFPEPGDDTTPTFLAYQIYRERGMNLDALKALQSLLSKSPEDGELTRMRRDLCEEMGLAESDVARAVQKTA